MKKTLTISIIFVLGLVVSCSEQEFSPLPSDTCVNVNATHGEDSCVTNPENGYNTLSYSVNSCQADILFVVDNSGSMYAEQTQLAQRFPNFLDSIKDLDYNIAVTTTDVSLSPNNNNEPKAVKARQDGKLIVFDNGKKFITPSTKNAQTLFEKNVKREETQNCDSGINEACPSSDERGILAVNMALYHADDRGNFGPKNFFRPKSHLAIVFLSDENVRSDAGLGSNNTLYDPAHYDKPQSLIDYVEDTFGKTKTVSAHPIVVQSGLTSPTGSDDTACHFDQATQANTSNSSLRRYGTYYEQLALAKKGTVDGSTVSSLKGLVPGHAGSICEGNYTPVVSKIGESIAKNAQVTDLKCEPENLKITIGGSEVPASAYSLTGKRLKLPPTCEDVKVTYDCPRSI